MTTISCRDVLQLIAEQIDDKKTWRSFALANRTTAQIARMLKEQKRIQLDFWYRAYLSVPLPNEPTGDFVYWTQNIAGKVINEVQINWDNLSETWLSELTQLNET